MGAADGGIERPIREALVDKIVRLNGGRDIPEVCGLGLQKSRRAGVGTREIEEVWGDHEGRGARAGLSKCVAISRAVAFLAAKRSW